MIQAQHKDQKIIVENMSCIYVIATQNCKFGFSYLRVSSISFGQQAAIANAMPVLALSWLVSALWVLSKGQLLTPFLTSSLFLKSYTRQGKAPRGSRCCLLPREGSGESRFVSKPFWPQDGPQTPGYQQQESTSHQSHVRIRFLFFLLPENWSLTHTWSGNPWELPIATFV